MMMTSKLTLTQEWDKTFPPSSTVDHEKVTFDNGYGITLVADLYKPKGDVPEGGYAAIAVSGPFGAVKEQASGLYAQTMAERGFLTIAFDPSFTGESTGKPRYTASPDINTEDFMSAVDYLVCRDDVNENRVGVIGICGWGGIALNAAAADPRIKATVASTMYDMTRIAGNGYYDADDSAEKRIAARKALAAQRTADAKTGSHVRVGGVVDPLPDDAPQFVRDYYGYYKTPRGYHARSLNANNAWNAIGTQAYANARFLHYTDEIENAVMVMHGEKAHSFYMGRDAFEKIREGVNPDNKVFLAVPDAVHCDLYDGGPEHDRIPWDTVEEFFTSNLV